MASLQLKVGDRVVDVDPDDFTLGEAELVEEIGGRPFMEVVDQLNRGGMRAVVAIAYVALRRADPTLTLDELRATRLTAISAPEEGEDEAGPPVAAGAGEAGSG